MRTLLPIAAAVRVEIEGPPRSFEDWRNIIPDDVNLEAQAEKLFDADLARIRHLETKLAAQLTFLTPLVPLAVALGTVAVREGLPVAAGLTFASAAYLLVTYLVALQAYQASMLSMPVPAHVAGSMTDDPSGAGVVRELALRRLWAVEANQPHATKLNNLIWAAGRSLIYGVVLLAVAGVAAFIQ